MIHPSVTAYLAPKKRSLNHPPTIGVMYVSEVSQTAISPACALVTPIPPSATDAARNNAKSGFVP